MTTRKEIIIHRSNGDTIKLVGIRSAHLDGSLYLSNFAIVQRKGEKNFSDLHEGIGDRGLFKIVSIHEVVKLNASLFR